MTKFRFYSLFMSVDHEQFAGTQNDKQKLRLCFVFIFIFNELKNALQKKIFFFLLFLYERCCTIFACHENIVDEIVN